LLADSPWLLPAVGLLIGLVAGATARWNHFCTLSALERYWYADDSRGVRTWVLAGTVALLSTQLLIAFNIINIEQSFYLRPSISLIGAVVGGTLFGIGMALVGTCGFGALVRLGSGSLRSLIIVSGIGLAALSAQKGLTGKFRTSMIEPLSIELGAQSQSLHAIAESVTGLSLQLPIALLIAAALFYWIFSNREFRSDNRSIICGSIIGACVTAGWVATSSLANYMYRQVQIESASFVLPQGELIFSTITATDTIPDYGMGMVIGVVLGSMLIALATKDIHWEACDDARELSRHLVGAFLMGTGGVLAAGCTIGQGVSAFSTMAASAPIVFFSICLGARIGLRLLLEGMPSFFRSTA